MAYTDAQDGKGGQMMIGEDKYSTHYPHHIYENNDTVFLWPLLPPEDL